MIQNKICMILEKKLIFYNFAVIGKVELDSLTISLNSSCKA